MKTKDGERIQIGMWVSDTSGIYEITAIGEKWIIAREIVFRSDDGVSDWVYGDTSYWLPREVKKMQCVAICTL